MSDDNNSLIRRFFTAGRGRWIVAAILATVVIIATVVAVNARPIGPVDAEPTQTPSAEPESEPAASPSPTDTASQPPPSAGGSVSPDGREVAPPVQIDSSAVIAPGLSASVASLEAVDGEARAPGDVAGPSVRITLVITNGTADAVDLATARTNMYFGADASPAAELPGPGTVALPASVAAGQSVTTTVVFSVPTSARDDVTIQFDYSVDVPIIAFRGAAPR